MTSDGRGVATTEAGLAELGRRYALTDAVIVSLGCLLGLLVTDPAAPTALKSAARVIGDHLADALVALELDQVRDARRIADLGSGAGVPGLPLAIVLGDAEIFLVESNTRKCAFIERAILECRIQNAQVVNARAEAWRDGLGRFDLVTARALAPLAVVAEYAAPLLSIGGSLVAWRGRRDPDAEAAAALAAEELGLRVDEPIRVLPYEGAEHRYLHPMTKVNATTARFPRRVGVAAKRPLGAQAHGASTNTYDREER